MFDFFFLGVVLNYDILDMRNNNLIMLDNVSFVGVFFEIVYLLYNNLVDRFILVGVFEGLVDLVKIFDFGFNNIQKLLIVLKELNMVEELDVFYNLMWFLNFFFVDIMRVMGDMIIVFIFGNNQLVSWLEFLNYFVQF